MTPKVIPLLFLVFCLSGCDYRHVQHVREAKQEALAHPQRLKSALQVIPYAAEFTQTFPEAAPDVYGSRDEFQFGSDVGIHSRYVLSLRVPFTTAADRVSVVSYGRPEFSLAEVSHVDRLPDGRLSTGFLPAREFRFGPKEWSMVVSAKGDFSVVGYTMITNMPVQFFGEIWRNHHEKAAYWERTSEPHSVHEVLWPRLDGLWKYHLHS